MGDIVHGLDHRLVDGAGIQVFHETSVNFDAADGQVLQIGEASHGR